MRKLKNSIVREKLSSYAKNRTKEHQDKLNIALGKRVVSDETRHRMSQSAKARSDRKRSVGGDAR